MSLLLNSNDTKLVALAYRIREKLDNNPVWQVAKQLNQAEITSSTTPRHIEEQLQAERQQVINNNNAPQQQTLAQREVRIQQELRAAGLDSDMLRIISFSTGFQISREDLRIEHLLDERGEIDNRLSTHDLQQSMETLSERSDFVKQLNNPNSKELALINKKLERTTNVQIETNNKGEQVFVRKDNKELTSKDLTKGVVESSALNSHNPPHNEQEQKGNINKSEYNAKMVNTSQSTVDMLSWEEQYQLALKQNRDALFRADKRLTSDHTPEEEKVKIFQSLVESGHPEIKTLARLAQGNQDLTEQQRAYSPPPPLFSLHNPDSEEMAKLFADKKSYYADIQDFTQGRKSYFKLLAHYDAKTRFELYRKAGLDEHTITQYEYGVRNVDKHAYDRDAEKAYGAETAAKMRADLAKLPHPNHDPTKLTINWRSANKEEKTVNLTPQAENKNSEETKNIQEVKNNFATLTPSATGEKNTTAAEEEEKVNQRYLTEQEKLEQAQKEELQQRKSLTV